MTQVSGKTQRRWVRIAAWTMASVVALFVAAALALYFLVPRDKIIARVVPAVERALGRSVHLGDAGISFWPPFGIFLADLRVHARDTSETDLLQMQELHARLAWRPLFSGELRFSTLSIQGLSLYYEQKDDSTSNITDLLTGEGGLWPALVEDLEFENLQLTMADRRDTSLWSLTGVHLELRLDPILLEFEARAAFPGVRVGSPAGDTTYDGPLVAELSGAVQKSPLAVTLERLEGSIRDVPLSGKGAFRTAGETSAVEGRLQIGPVSVSRLLEYVPAQRRAALSGYELGGDVRVNVTASGPLDSLARGAAIAEIRWSQGRVTDSLGDWLTFSELAIPMDHAGFHVDAQDMVSRYGPVRVAVVGSWPPEGRLELSVSGQSDLTRFMAKGEASASGTLEWSASAMGPMDAPALWRLLARAQLRGARFEEVGRDPFEITSAELSYDGSELRLEHLRAGFGRSDVELSGRVTGLSWADYMADRPLVPQAALSMQSHRLDLDYLFPHLAGDSAAPADTGSRPPLPPGRAVISADIDTLVLGGALWRSMHGEFSLADGQLRIDTLFGKVYGGRIRMSGEIDSLALAHAPYDFTVSIDSLEMGDLLGRFGSAGRYLRGKSDLSAHLQGRGATPEQVMQDLVVDGSVLLFGTRLENFQAAQKVQSLLGLKEQEQIPIRSLSNRFRFEGGRAQVDDFKFTTPQGSWALGGSAGLDGSLDYRLTGQLPASVAAGLKLPESWSSALPAAWQGKVDPLDLLKNDEGAIDLFFKIGGTLRAPAVEVDWEKLQPLFAQRFESRVKQKVTEEAQKELKEGLKGLFDKLKR